MKKTVSFKGRIHNVFTIFVDGIGSIDVILLPEQYRSGNSLAIEVLCVEDGRVTEPWSTLTVNLDPYTGMGDQSDTKAFVDTNNNPWAADFISETEIADFAGCFRRSGYCTYPLYSFDLSKLYADAAS